MSRWIEFDPTDHTHIPESPGCYVVYGDGEIVYVGQSVNLRTRFRSHGVRLWHHSGWVKTPWGNFRAVVAKRRVPKVFGEWAMTECRLISRLRPPHNRRVP